MDKPIRKLHRLQGYDYRQNGYYFVTICTQARRKILCTVGNAVPGVPPPMVSTEVGRIVLRAWNRMSEIDPGIHTDYFCMMPNHIHGIIVIDSMDDGAAQAELKVSVLFQDVSLRTSDRCHWCGNLHERFLSHTPRGTLKNQMVRIATSLRSSQ